MTWRRGQALLELALCAPVIVLLALGLVAVVQLQDGAAGLDAATKAAAQVASRAPDPQGADTAAHARFADIISAYPLHLVVVRVTFGTFNRGADVAINSEAVVDVGWVGLMLPARFTIHSHATAQFEPWRTHRAAS